DDDEVTYEAVADQAVEVMLRGRDSRRRHPGVALVLGAVKEHPRRVEATPAELDRAERALERGTLARDDDVLRRAHVAELERRVLLDERRGQGHIPVAPGIEEEFALGVPVEPRDDGRLPLPDDQRPPLRVRQLIGARRIARDRSGA